MLVVIVIDDNSDSQSNDDDDDDDDVPGSEFRELGFTALSALSFSWIRLLRKSSQFMLFISLRKTVAVSAKISANLFPQLRGEIITPGSPNSLDPPL